ncbi:hypothetical protein ACFSL6_17775 [Paenibacillus thailandensis]|uniref:Uncharacterized protein n=1 Tax=Paenibacillus thailandensis TaxID=393250 RepID=A0ABW5QT07_9BACL
MNFDLGGFTGGLIGTFGAFGVAFYTLRHQSKKEFPTKQKMKYKIVLALTDEIINANNELVAVLYDEKSSNIILFLIFVKKFSYSMMKSPNLPKALRVISISKNVSSLWRTFTR